MATRVCSVPRVHSIALTREIALTADALAMHSDPADRFIAATATTLDAQLVTKDNLLRKLAWQPTHW